MRGLASPRPDRLQDALMPPEHRSGGHRRAMTADPNMATPLRTLECTVRNCRRFCSCSEHLVQCGSTAFNRSAATPESRKDRAVCQACLALDSGFDGPTSACRAFQAARWWLRVRLNELPTTPLTPNHGTRHEQTPAQSPSGRPLVQNAFDGSRRMTGSRKTASVVFIYRAEMSRQRGSV